MTETIVESGQVVSVEKDATLVKKDGGTYKALKLTYMSGGRARIKSIHSIMIPKKTELVAKLLALAPGATIEVTTEGGPFFNLVDVRELAAGSVVEQPAPVAAAKPTTARAPFVDNSIGMQVGNALTNASTLIAAGDSRSLEEVAISVLVLGESLKVRLVAGEFANKPVEVKADPPKAKAKKAVPVVEELEEDNPFEDN